MTNKKYHFYIDEGGFIGNCNISINIKPIKKEEISIYYFGKLSIESIIRHLQLFNLSFPKCIIMYDNISDIKDLDLEEYSM